MSVEPVIGNIHRLSVHVGALAALGAALRLQRSGAEADSQVQSRLQQVIPAIGPQLTEDAALSQGGDTAPLIEMVFHQASSRSRTRRVLPVGVTRARRYSNLKTRCRGTSSSCRGLCMSASDKGLPTLLEVPRQRSMRWHSRHGPTRGIAAREACEIRLASPRYVRFAARQNLQEHAADRPGDPEALLAVLLQYATRR